MFKALSRIPRPAPTPASLPQGQRVYAIGDIHGRADLLKTLLAAIERDDAGRPAADTRIVLLGDLIDRGPHSADVVDMAIALAERRPETRFLMGNHEEMLLSVLDGDVKTLGVYLRFGGRETLQSYGIANAEIDALDDTALIALIRERVPVRHADFLRGFDDLTVAGGYVFVHAGLRPGVELDAQKTSDLRWIREPFLGHRGSFGAVVVHGHSITDDVDERPNRIGIDTGASYSGRLTAIGLDGDRRWYLST